ncbi:hypothetical protein Y1Q_0005417 [Alligator mississippiensis]|uniref:Uncharacterized protein n=1 Tax=Alligator mississippiensis TaxID=8496 RepID=A0A151MZQ1_ALLMI|nr:hypothetical protein Y1Q_0005417 [Alligator mississippiensis]
MFAAGTEHLSSFPRSSRVRAPDEVPPPGLGATRGCPRHPHVVIREAGIDTSHPLRGVWPAPWPKERASPSSQAPLAALLQHS